MRHPEHDLEHDLEEGRRARHVRVRHLVVTGALAAGLIVGAATAAGATDPYPSGGAAPPQVQSNVVTKPVAAPRTSPSGATLPFTGGDVLGLAAIGGGAVAVGSAMRALRRRPAH